MSNLSTLRTIVQYRVSDLGVNYQDYIDHAINWAIGEVAIVNWRFLYKELSLVLASGTTALDLWDNSVTGYCDFGRMYKVYLTSGSSHYELKKGTAEDIKLNPLSSTGRPRLYAITGFTTNDSSPSDSAPQLLIGYPTADANYTITAAYYKKLPDLSNDSDESDISVIYRDDPIVEGAIYRMWKTLEVEDKAVSAMNKFLLSMRSMAAVCEYDGPSYDEILKINSAG